MIIMALSIINCNAQSRSVQKINGNWKFTLGDIEIEEIMLPETSWENIVIPHTWNDKDIQSGDKVHYGTAWYKRDLILKDSIPNKHFFLKFDGVGQYAELYVNKHYVGKHLGSYSAFAFDITGFLKNDTVNTILLKVNNELADSYPKDNFLFGIYGGIYRDVSLIITNDVHLALTDHASSGVYVYQEDVNDKNASLKIETLIKNETSERKDVSIRNTLLSKDVIIFAIGSEDYTVYPGGAVPVISRLEVKNPHLWQGKTDPFLYTLKTEIFQDGKVVDIVTQQIGIRYFHIDPERGFFLNGEPYRLYGVCRHQEWEDLGNALLPAHHRRDMELIDELGATSIRLAHYQQADYIYDLADSLGFLIWAEIPFVNGYKENADNNAKQQLTELIKQNFNHPSIFVWGLHNEVIKGDVIQQAVNLTKELHNLAKTLDKNRYTVSVSNIWWVYDHDIHEMSDLQGFNQYTGWYGGKPSELRNWINNYHEKKPDIRFSVSEYGAGGNIAHQSCNDTTPPHPKSQFFPESYQSHYHEQTYAAIESSPFIWGSYIWNMFDFSVPEWNRGGIKGRNHKGLVTYDRKTKKDAFYWYKANWSDENVLYLRDQRNNTLDTNICNFTAYCNFGIPELFINGKSYGKMKQGVNSVHFVNENISLPPGKYNIEIKAVDKEMIHHDEFELNINH